MTLIIIIIILKWQKWRWEVPKDFGRKVSLISPFSFRSFPSHPLSSLLSFFRTYLIFITKTWFHLRLHVQKLNYHLLNHFFFSFFTFSFYLLPQHSSFFSSNLSPFFPAPSPQIFPLSFRLPSICVNYLSYSLVKSFEDNSVIFRGFFYFLLKV